MSDPEKVYRIEEPATTEVEDPANIVVDAYTLQDWGSTFPQNVIWANLIDADEYTTEDKLIAMIELVLTYLRLKNTSLSNSGSAVVHVYLHSQNDPNHEHPIFHWEFSTPTIAPDSTYEPDLSEISAEIVSETDITVWNPDSGAQSQPQPMMMTIEVYTGGEQTDFKQENMPNDWLEPLAVVDIINAVAKSTLKRGTYKLNEIFETLTWSYWLVAWGDQGMDYVGFQFYLKNSAGTVTIVKTIDRTFEQIITNYGDVYGENVDLLSLIGDEEVDLSGFSADVYTLGFKIRVGRP